MYLQQLKEKKSMIFMALESETDRLKIENIYCKYGKLMYLAAFEILENKEQAEDAVHSSFIKIIDLIDNIDESNQNETCGYVVIICKTVALNMLKRRKIGLEKEIAFESEKKIDSPPEEVLLKLETLGSLIKAINQLKPIYKEIFLFRYAHNLMPKKIAEITEMNEDTVKKRLLRAKAQIAEILKKEELV